MKKSFLILLSILIVSISYNNAFAENNYNDLLYAIQLYKQGNFSQCYTELEKFVEKDPSNAIAFYYLGMTSAQIGRGDEAVANYNRAISLTANSNKLKLYAEKGKRCIEDPEKCTSSYTESGDAMYILDSFNTLFSEEAKQQHENLRIENIRREMNRENLVEPQKLKEYKDFSSVPTNEEIGAAFRTLQNAGFGNFMNNNNDLSFLTNTPQQNSIYNMMGNSNMNPQLIQTLLTNSMTQGF